MSLQPKILQSRFARLVDPGMIAKILEEVSENRPIIQVVKRYNLDTIYGDQAKARYALSVFINQALESPELTFRIFGVPKEVMYKLLENKAVIAREKTAVDLKHLNSEIVEGVNPSSLVKLNTETINKMTATRLMEMLGDKTKKIPFQSLSWLFAVTSDKIRLYSGEATQNIAIHAKIDVKGMTTDEIVKQLLKGREKHLSSLPKKMLKTK